MSVARNSNGGLEVFARGSDNALWHKWQTAEGWSDWHSLGGNLRGGPTVAVHAGGGLEVFSVASDGALWHIWQEAGGWSQWHSLGGRLIGSPTVAVNHDKRLEVFAQSPDHKLWHIWQLPSYRQWSDWTPMNVAVVGNPAVGRDTAESGLRLFVRGPDRTVQYSHQVSPSVSERWSSFTRLTGPATTDVSVAISQDGRMELFFADDAGAMRHVWQLRLATHEWSSPGNFGGILGERPAAIKNRDGRLEIFHIGRDGRVHNAWQTRPNNGFSGWHPRELNGVGAFPVVAMNGDGRLEVFAIGGGNVLHMWQDRASAGPWRKGNLGGQTLGGLGRGIVELGRCSLWEAYYLS
jgi:hypothetical protein